jgi:LmbE family N-acetylglucosaminyl deacetylase
MAAILVISPHPDDEAIGLGGTLRSHVLKGDSVEVVFLTSGERGIPQADPAATAALRESEAAAAAAILGYTGFDFWRQPDGAVVVTASLVERLRDRLQTRRPNIVYVTHPREMHPDHHAAARLVADAVAASSAPSPAILMYEVWTPLQAIDEVVDISDHIDVKLAAIRAHASQCAIMRFDDAALGLARYRGEMHSWPGGPHAEVFEKYDPSRYDAYFRQ